MPSGLRRCDGTFLKSPFVEFQGAFSISFPVGLVQPVLYQLLSRSLDIAQRGEILSGKEK